MDTIIVTIRVAKSGQQYDMEVSPHVPCGELAKQIVSAIELENSTVARDIKNPYLATEAGHRLADSKTLASMGIWDGSIITINAG